MEKINGIVLQSGGPTAVINASLYGVWNGWHIKRKRGRLFSSLFGPLGLLNKQIIELYEQDNSLMSGVARTPSAGLGSARHNLRDEKGNPDKDKLEKIFDALDPFQISHLFLIGGDDSRENAYAISLYAKRQGVDFKVFHIPKTIDNDLTFTHHSPGFGSAAKFVIYAVAGNDLDNRAMPGVMIDVVMGREAGWLAAASILARQGKDAGPHLVYVPECDFSKDKFLRDIDSVMRKHNRAHIVVAEGVAEKSAISDYVDEIGGKAFLAELCGKDDFGHLQLSGNGVFGAILAHMVKKGLKVKRVRANTFDYLQRSFPGVISEIDFRQAYEVGYQAVISSLSEQTDNAMMSIGTEKEFKYNHKLGWVELQKVFSENRNKPKLLPLALIIDGCDISADFHNYMGPLIDGTPVFQTLPFDELSVVKKLFFNG